MANHYRPPANIEERQQRWREMFNARMGALVVLADKYKADIEDVKMMVWSAFLMTMVEADWQQTLGVVERTLQMEED